MIKELTVYRKDFKEFVLKSSNVASAYNLNLDFGPNELVPDDVLWLKEDAQKNERDTMLVVDYVDPDGPVRVRLANAGFVRDIKTFSEGDVFILVASFKIKEHGNPEVHIS